jgi:hypothetical protein
VEPKKRKAQNTSRTSINAPHGQRVKAVRDSVMGYIAKHNSMQFTMEEAELQLWNDGVLKLGKRLDSSYLYLAGFKRKGKGVFMVNKLKKAA